MAGADTDGAVSEGGERLPGPVPRVVKDAALRAAGLGAVVRRLGARPRRRSMELVAAVAPAVPGLRRSFGGRPGLLPAGTGLAAAGPLPDPAVDPQAGSLAILESLRASTAGRTP